MRIVLTGGGTGGHVYPNIAVIEEFKRRGDEVDILYIGSKYGMDEGLVKGTGVVFKGITTGKLRRYFSWDNFKDFFRVPLGTWQAWGILRKFKPDVVFSKGGYVAFPVVLAAYLRRIPVIVHESDIVPGLANKMAMRFAKKVLLSFQETEIYLKEAWKESAMMTGSIVRRGITAGDRQKAYELTEFSEHKKVILVMGGSQGAAEINEMVRDMSYDFEGSVLGGALRKLGVDKLENWQMVHITGVGKALDIAKGLDYSALEYANDDLKDLYAIADIVVTRGGAGSLAELAFLQKKAIIVPMANATRGEQVLNARYYAGKMGWIVIGEDDFKRNGNLNFDLGGAKIVDLILNFDYAK